MLKEFALEPEAVSRWESLRYFADRFGTAQGRLISQYPQTWLRDVWDQCAEETPLRRQRFQATLDMLRSRLIKTGRPYSASRSWLQNAMDAHRAEPFSAIIAATGNHQPEVLCADEITDQTALWKVEPSGKCSRSARELAALVAPLLRLSTKIRFIDQHFKCTARYCRPLAEFLQLAFSGKKPDAIEYHVNADDSADSFRSGLERQQWFLKIPGNEHVTFRRWRCIDGGENLHPRYILTNRGGVRIDYGLDEGDQGETTDWNLMTDEHREERFRQFDRNSPCFQLVDEWQVTAAGVSPIER